MATATTTDGINGNVGDKYNTGAHYGADHERQSASWTEAMEALNAAFTDGFLDDHLGTIVLACIERRNHLARFGLVASVPEAKAKPVDANPVTATSTSAYSTPVAKTTNTRDAYITAYGDKYPKAHVVGAVANYEATIVDPSVGGTLTGVRGIDGVKVVVTGAGRTKLTVRLLERPATGIRWQRVFDNKEDISISPEHLSGLFER